MSAPLDPSSAVSAMKAVTPTRPESTPAETERLELEWWRTFAEIEEKFCWVQTPAMQRVLRGWYVQQIVERAGTGGRILELGCGVGWLCFILAEAGARDVVGIDFSPSQIAIAQRRAQESGLGERVRFYCADGTQEASATEKYDCVVVHGFLHHLNNAEIHRTLAGIPKLLKPDGVFIVFEPVWDPERAGRSLPRGMKLQHFLMQCARSGSRYGLRRYSVEEKGWRELLLQRGWGTAPHGPSPKEMPFKPGELEGFLHPYFSIERRINCMAASHLVVQEWLLRGLSHPFSTRLLLPWIARVSAWADRHMIKSEDARLPDAWIHTMWTCRLRN